MTDKKREKKAMENRRNCDLKKENKANFQKSLLN